MDPRARIIDECGRIQALLLSKNEKYGNSALEPIRVFSQGTPTEQLLVRIDDKLKRIQNNHGFEDEDVVQDLVGYLILLMIAKRGELDE